MKPQPSATKPSPVRAVALLGLLTALCTVLRIVKGLLGYLYGFIVSLGMAVIGSLNGLGFWAYYVSGLPFDTYHAIGNLVFYPIVLAILRQGLQRFDRGGAHFETLHKSR